MLKKAQSGIDKSRISYYDARGLTSRAEEGRRGTLLTELIVDSSSG